MDYVKAGKVTHFFDKISVAVVEATDDDIEVGDMIRFGEDGGLEQKVESIQVDHNAVDKIAKGKEAGMKVNGAVKPNEVIYKQA